MLGWEVKEKKIILLIGVLLWLSWIYMTCSIEYCQKDGLSVKRSKRIGPTKSEGHFWQSTQKNNDHSDLQLTNKLILQFNKSTVTHKPPRVTVSLEIVPRVMLYINMALTHSTTLPLQLQRILHYNDDHSCCCNCNSNYKRKRKWFSQEKQNSGFQY